MIYFFVFKIISVLEGGYMAKSKKSQPSPVFVPVVNSNKPNVSGSSKSSGAKSKASSSKKKC